jgi:hypothetical protein
MPRNVLRSRQTTLESVLNHLRGNGVTVGNRINFETLSAQGLLDIDTIEQRPVFVLGGRNNIAIGDNAVDLFNQDSDASSDEEEDALVVALDAALAARRARRDARRTVGDPYAAPVRNGRRNGRGGVGPTQRLVSGAPFPIMPPADINASRATTLCPETNHLAADLTLFNITHTDGVVRTLGAVNGEGVPIIGKLIKFWYYQLYDDNGMYESWNRLLNDPKFIANQGPLQTQMEFEFKFAAAMLCYAVGRMPLVGRRNVGDACLPVNSHRTCSSIRHMHHGHEAYDRALVMAATIVNQHNVTIATRDLRIDDIMDYDLYNPYSRHVSKLRQHGIVSIESDTVGNHHDLQGVLLPFFFFMDALLPDPAWRNNCAVSNINVTRAQRVLIDNQQVRLHQETWD